MFEPVEEMSAAEAIKIFTEICSGHLCCECPIGSICNTITCNEIKRKYSEEVVKVVEQWKTDHEKKPIETEFIKLVRVIEDTGDCKKCVHEEKIETKIPELDMKISEVLKNWCKDHDGKFFAILERICRVKD